MKKILYFVQLPPPVHGVSTINNYIVNSEYINSDFEVQTLQIKFSDKISELQNVTIVKLIKAFVLAFRLIVKIICFKPHFIYFSIMPVGKGFVRDFIYVFIIKHFNVKVIYHLHNQGIIKAENSIILKKMYQFTFNNSIIIHLSESLMEKEVGFLYLSNTDKYIVNNGVEIIDKVALKNVKTKLTLLYLSNLFPEKGLNYLIEAINILNEKNYNFNLNIIGSMRDKQSINDIIQNNKSGNISYIGEVYNSEKYNYYLNADIFIHPTTNDSFPLVILDAMQFGLPVISTNEGAIPEIINNGINGIIVEKGNIQQLADSIELLINNSDLRIRMGQSGKDKFLEKYTKTIFEENIKKIFNNYL